MTLLQAIIFDLDGVLVDTVESHYRSWKVLADQLQIPFSREDMNRFLGRRRRDCLVDLLSGHLVEAAQFEAYLTLKDDLYRADVDRMTSADLLPGVQSLIAAAREHGLKLGVASSSQNARIVLQRTGILDHIEAVADGTTVCRPKPAPDAFVWVAGALRVRPSAALVIEDSAAGIEAGRTAGAFVVGVGDAQLTAGAHLTVATLEQAQLADLIAHYAAFVR
ncbi:MAG: beta-phosphoglucomutase family hydrolase [Anaerolineae bacterium]|nr:beta-phosphoglucomutase family hydrolase [Anaerolineae bacterium]